MAYLGIVYGRQIVKPWTQVVDSLFFEMERDESSNITPDPTALRLQNDGKDLGERSSGQPTETWSSGGANSGDTCLLISQGTKECVQFTEG